MKRQEERIISCSNDEMGSYGGGGYVIRQRPMGLEPVTLVLSQGTLTRGHRWRVVKQQSKLVVHLCLQKLKHSPTLHQCPGQEARILTGF